MAMIYFLDGNQRVIKIVRSEAVISAIQTQELPEDSSLLKDVLSVRLKNDERLFNAQYMAIKSYGGNRNAFDLYRIVNEIVPDNATSFEGVQIAPYELQGVVIEDLRPHNRPLDLTINQLLKDTDWTLGYVASNMPTVTTNFYYVSVKDALKKLQEMYGVEMIFKVEISGNRITSKWVEVYHQLGNRTMKRFNYGTNALSVVRESSQNELYTALIGRGKGEEVGETEEGDATYGRKITFEDVEWSTANGDPVDKPKGQKYIELPLATAEYGIRYKNGGKMPRVGIVDFSDTEEPEVLIEQTYQELLMRARPKVLFKASVINIGDVLIGDTVTIHRHNLNLHYQARVRKVIRDRKNNNKTQVEIGDVVHTPSTQKQKDTDSKLDNIADEIGDIKDDLITTVVSADGKNTLYFQNEEPQNPRVGDSWIRDHPSIEGETQWLVWNGEAWELILDSSDTTKNAREIEAIIEKAEEDWVNAEKQIEDAMSEAINEADRLAGVRDNNITITASQIRSGTIDTARLDSVHIVTQGLQADVIEAEHIKSSLALVDKIFADEAYIRRLTSKDIFAEAIQAVEISADQITSGEINASHVKIINLDVASLSGNITNFIQSYWNQAYSSVAITGDSVGMIHSNGVRPGGYAFELTDEEVRFGVPMYAYQGLDMRATDIVFGRDMSISANANPGNWLYIKGSSGNIAEFGGSVQIRVPFQTHSTMQAGGNIAMNNNHIYFGASANMYAPETDELQINIRGNRRVLYRNADINFYNDLNMRGYTITGQSDERLKRDITDTGINSLEVLKQTRFVGFNWIDEDLNAETGRQMGVLAQDTPHLHIYDQETDEWSIDTGKQIMVNSHAIQQLANEKDAEIAELKERLEVLENGS